MLSVCCVKAVQFIVFVTCTQRDGNNQIQQIARLYISFKVTVVQSAVDDEGMITCGIILWSW